MIIVLGTASNAGKTTLVAMLCRYLRKKGYSVSPFKALNLSLNSYVTENGGEIGIGQALQSWACGIEPIEEMNPILLKPSGNGRMQYVINGKVFSNKEKPSVDYMMTEAYESYDRLKSNYDIVVTEGSGSPVELNIIDRDIANMRIASAKDMNVLLVGDIERGGVFAAIYGTWLLIPENERHRVKAFVINRFRGDSSILKDGIERIESLTGMKCIGIMPYTDLMLPEEDSLSSNKKSCSQNIMDEYMKSLDNLLETASKCLDLNYLEELAK